MDPIVLIIEARPRLRRARAIYPFIIYVSVTSELSDHGRGGGARNNRFSISSFLRFLVVNENNNDFF